jgi:hypothetical protein
MANVNLKLNAERAFGKYLPTVYLKRVVVRANEEDPDVDRQSLVKVTADMSISFTKADNVEYRGVPGEADFKGPSVEEFIKNNLDDLYLYTFLSPFTRLNSELEKERLNLKDLLRAFDNLDDINQENFTADSPIWPLVREHAQQAWVDKEHFYGLDTEAPFGISPGSAEASQMSLMGLLATNTDLAAHSIYWAYPISEDVSATDLVKANTLLGNFETPGSSVHYIFYGDDGEFGPWNTPQSIKYETLKSIMMATKTAQDGIASTIDSPDAMASIVEEAESDAEYAEEIGLHTDELKESENSFLYEQLQRSLATHAPSAALLKQSKKIKLTDLIGETNPYGSSLTFNKTYSSENQEIFSISNIELNFLYEPGPGDSYTYVQELVEQLEKLFIVSTIGLDMETRVSYDEDATSDIPRELFNSFFGNITYEHVLSNNAVPNPYFEKFVFSKTKLTYDGIPIQGLNGKLYADEPFSRDDVIHNYDKLVAKYTEPAKSDKTLATHVKNLSVILSKSAASPNLIKDLKRFQRTFTDKSQTTISGRLYAEFNKNLTAINKKVMRQEQVEKRVVVNATCLDLRPQRVVGDVYILPTPNTYEVSSYWASYAAGEAVPGFTATRFPMAKADNRTLSHFIPQNWSRVFRSLDYMKADTIYSASEAEQHKRWLIYRTIEEYSGTPGVTEEAIVAAVDAALDAAFGAGVSDIDGDGTSLDLDIIVKNQGYFFFDYEKALYSQCALAQVVDLPKLCVFLGTSLPYANFRVKSVSLKREEVNITDFYATEADATGAADGTGDPIPTHTVEMKSYFDTTREIPVMYKTDHTVTGNNYKYGKPVVTLGQMTAGTSDDHTKYSHVRFTDFDVTGTEQTRGETRRLHNIGAGPFSWGVTSQGLGTKHADLTGIGTTITLFSRSYRLMAFEFEDYMDDDVALNNSPAFGYGHSGQTSNSAMDTLYDSGAGSVSGFGGWNDIHRRDVLTTLNPWDEPSTHYDVEIVVEDTTIKFFNMIYANLIEPLVEAWEEYHEYAEELCSYNKSENAFNQFFVDAMIEKYITSRAAFSTHYSEEDLFSYGMAGLAGSSEASASGLDASALNFKDYAAQLPPWVSGAFLSAVIKEIFFNSTPRTRLYHILDKLTLAMNEFDASSGPADPSIVKFVREMYSISPQKGNITALREFDSRIRPLIDIFRYNDPQMKQALIDYFDLEGMTVLDSGESIRSLVEAPRELTFHSTIKIDTPVAVGEYRDSFYLDTMRILRGISAADVTPEPPVAVTIPSIPGAFLKTLSTIGSHVTFYSQISTYGGPGDLGRINGLLALGGPESTNSQIMPWMKALPDYDAWQRRFNTPGDTFDPGDLPEDIEDAASLEELKLRIYLPKAYASARVLDHDPTLLPYIQVFAPYGGAGGSGTYPRPKRFRIHYWLEPEGDYDFDTTSVSESSDY